MVQLIPMTPETFEAFLQFSITDYADVKVKSGNWKASEALQRSRDEHSKLLPDGLATPGHHIYNIVDEESHEIVGVLWMAEYRDWVEPTGFIYDINIEERFRQRGYASQAMLALEVIAHELGLETLALHVFGFNLVARHLYEKLGYEITNINMAKKLKPQK